MKKNLAKVDSDIVLWMYNICLIAIILSPLLSYLYMEQLSRYICTFFLSLSIIVVIGIKILNIQIIEVKAHQYLTIFLILSLFYIASFCNKYTLYSNKITYLFILEIVFTVLNDIVWVSFCNVSSLLKKFWNYIKTYKLLFLFLIAYFILMLEGLHSWTNWDSKAYYSFITNLKNITFSPNDIAAFKSAGHMSYAYMFFMAIGEFVLPSYGVGCRLVNIILLMISVIYLNKILNFIFKNNKILNISLTIVFALTPTIWGPIYEQNLEMSILFCFILFFWFYISKKNILATFFGTLLVFTKETSILLVAGVAIGAVILELIKEKNIKRIFETSFIKQMLIYYIPCCLFMLYYSIDGSGWAKNTTADKAKEINVFTVNWIYISGKIKQMFFSNFQWTITILLVFGILSVLFAIRKNKLEIKNCKIGFIIPLLTAYFFFICIQLLYVTYLFPRYIVVNYFFMIVLLGYVLNFLEIKYNILQVVLVGIMVLFFKETFWTIDSVTLACFETIDIGEGKLAPANILLTYDEKTILYGKDARVMALSPYTSYNRQFLYKYKMFEKVLETIEYSNNDLIILPDINNPISNGTYWGYESSNYYDSKSKKVYQFYEPITSEKDDKEFINYIIQGDEIKKININKYSNVYFIDFPYETDFDSDLTIENYDAKLFRKIDYRGWTSTIYKIK